MPTHAGRRSSLQSFALPGINASKLLEETSQGVTGAASASDEFVMSIGEISRQAASSADKARDASQTAQDADRTIRELDAMATQVNTLVEMISQIAQRTNLLASMLRSKRHGAARRAGASRLSHRK